MSSQLQGMHSMLAFLFINSPCKCLKCKEVHAPVLQVLTCTQNDATHGVVNSEFLRCCKRAVRIVNVARGGLLDYEAVRQARVSPTCSAYQHV